MSKTEQSILAAKTPEEYISLSLKAKISPSAKARLAREWMAATGYTKEDILAARNRHPYWKKKKMEGSAERTRRRLSEHDYSRGKSVPWDRERIEEFLSLNGKGADGRYEKKDWELAERFAASIPSIQYMRRKHAKVLGLLGPKAARAKVAEYLLLAESVLNRGPEALSAKPKATAGSKAAPAKGVTAKSSGASGKASAKPAAKAVAKPAAKGTAKPVPKATAKPAVKKASKPAPKATAKPAPKATAKTAAKAKDKAAPKTVKPASKAASKAAAKPAAKPAKPAPKATKRPK